MYRLSTCALLITAVCGAAARAEEPSASSVLPLAGIDELVSDLVDTIEALGLSDCDSAAETITGYGLMSAKDSASAGYLERAKALLHPFQQRALRFESVDFIGAGRLSSAAVGLSFIGNSDAGPVLFQVNAYRCRDAWRLEGFSFHFGWANVAERSRADRFSEPVTYRLRGKNSVEQAELSDETERR